MALSRKRTDRRPREVSAHYVMLEHPRSFHEACMPRYEYRSLNPIHEAERTFLAWIDRLDSEFANRDVEHRCVVVRDALHQIYLGRPYAPPDAKAGLAEQALVYSLDPRN